MQKDTTMKNANDEVKEDFKIIVTYAENGQSFQSIAEKIIIRKINEI